MEQFLTPKEVAGMLRVTVKTIWRQIERGEIPAVKVGSRWRIPRAGLERALGLGASNGD